MKNRALKIVVILLISIVVFLAQLTWGVIGCYDKTPTQPPKYEEREVGDFIVRFFSDYCEIMGTSEQGNQKRFLIIPKYIDGVIVESLGYKGLTLLSHGLVKPEIESNMVEKVYFEAKIKINPSSFYPTPPKLKKVMYPKEETKPYYLDKYGFSVYYPREVYNRLDEIDKYSREQANVSYYSNYENGENYYWIDDCDYGSKIEFIPPEPIRVGYTFGGWYKETECINLWDFDNDTLPEEKTELKEIYPNGELAEVPIYQETILYAKWLKASD